MASDVDRALAKLSAVTARTAGELATLYARADVLPMPIRVQFSNAVEELDLLRFMLHEATLAIAIHGTLTPVTPAETTDAATALAPAEAEGSRVGAAASPRARRRAASAAPPRSPPA